MFLSLAEESNNRQISVLKFNEIATIHFRVSGAGLGGIHSRRLPDAGVCVRHG